MGSMVPELRSIQEKFGYLPAEQLELLATELGVPLSQIHGVASFYPHFHLTPPPRIDVRVCSDMSCHLRGGDELRRHVGAGLPRQQSPDACHPRRFLSGTMRPGAGFVRQRGHLRQCRRPQCGCHAAGSHDRRPASGRIFAHGTGAAGHGSLQGRPHLRRGQASGGDAQRAKA